MELFRLYGAVDVNGNQALGTLRNITNTAAQAEGGLRGIASQAVAVAAGFGLWQGISGMFSTAAREVFGFSSQLQQAQIGFETMLGSADQATKFLTEIKDFAAATPFEFPQLLDASKRMLAFGFAAKEILPMMTAVGDAASGLGRGAEGINRITLALGQMKAKNKVQAEEMLQLTEVGINGWEMLAQAMGKSTQEVMKLSEKGLLPAEQAIKDLVKGMEEQFPGMMAAQANTMEGMTSTIKDNVRNIAEGMASDTFKSLSTVVGYFRDATTKIWEAFKAGGTQGVMNLIPPNVVTAAQVLFDLLVLIAGAYAGIKVQAALATAVQATMWAVGQVRVFLAAASAVPGVLAGIRAGMIALQLSIPVWGWLAAAVGVAAGSLFLYNQRQKEVAAANMTEEQQYAAKLQAYGNEKAILESTTASATEKAAAQARMNEITSATTGVVAEVNKAYGSEGIQIDILTGKIDENTQAILENLQVKMALAGAAYAEASAAVTEAAKGEVADPLFGDGSGGNPMQNIDLKADMALKAQDLQNATTEYEIYTKAVEQAQAAAAKARKKLRGDGAGAGGSGKSQADDDKLYWEKVGNALKFELREMQAQAEESLYSMEANAKKPAEKIQYLTALQVKLNEQIRKQEEVVQAAKNAVDEAAASDKLSEEEKQKYKEAVITEGTALVGLRKQLAEAEQSIIDATEAEQKHQLELEESADKVTDLADKYKKDLAEAAEDYHEKVTKLMEDEADGIEDLNQRYKDAVVSRTDSLMDWVGLFDAIPEQAQVTGEELLKNLEDQVAMFQDWQANIDKLADRGISDGLLAKLREMGPSAAAQVAALAGMTDEELARYSELYGQKQAEAKESATAELEGLKRETQQKIIELSAQTATQLQSLKAEWDTKNKEIKESTIDALNEMIKAAAEKGPEFKAAILSALAISNPELLAAVAGSTGAAPTGAGMASTPEEVANQTEAMEGRVETAWSNMNTAVTTTDNALSMAVNTNWQNTKNNLVTLNSQLLTDTQNTWRDIKKEIFLRLGELQTRMEKFVKDSYTWGQNFVTEFSRGVIEKADELRRAFEALAALGAAYARVQSPTEKGPWRDLDKWGPNFVETIAAGIESKLPRMEQASLAMASTVQAPLAVGGGGGTIQQLTMEFYGVSDIADFADKMEAAWPIIANRVGIKIT